MTASAGDYQVSSGWQEQNDGESGADQNAQHNGGGSRGSSRSDGNRSGGGSDGPDGSTAYARESNGSQSSSGSRSKSRIEGNGGSTAGNDLASASWTNTSVDVSGEARGTSGRSVRLEDGRVTRADASNHASGKAEEVAKTSSGHDNGKSSHEGTLTTTSNSRGDSFSGTDKYEWDGKSNWDRVGQTQTGDVLSDHYQDGKNSDSGEDQETLSHNADGSNAKTSNERKTEHRTTKKIVVEAEPDLTGVFDFFVPNRWRRTEEAWIIHSGDAGWSSDYENGSQGAAGGSHDSDGKTTREEGSKTTYRGNDDRTGEVQTSVHTITNTSTSTSDANGSYGGSSPPSGDSSAGVTNERSDSVVGRETWPHIQTDTDKTTTSSSTLSSDGGSESTEKSRDHWKWKGSGQSGYANTDRNVTRKNGVLSGELITDSSTSGRSVQEIGGDGSPTPTLTHKERRAGYRIVNGAKVNVRNVGTGAGETILDAASGAGQWAWETVKVWDNEEVANTHSALRDQGYSWAGAAATAFLGSVGERFIAGSLENAISGRSSPADGNRDLGTGERLLNGAFAGLDLGGSAGKAGQVLKEVSEGVAGAVANRLKKNLGGGHRGNAGKSIDSAPAPKKAATNAKRGRFDYDHADYDDALRSAREHAGDLGDQTQKMYDPRTGTLIGERSADGKRGWRIDNDHINYWDWTGGKKGQGGRYGHEYFPESQAGPHSEHIGYAPWVD